MALPHVRRYRFTGTRSPWVAISRRDRANLGNDDGFTCGSSKNVNELLGRKGEFGSKNEMCGS